MTQDSGHTHPRHQGYKTKTVRLKYDESGHDPRWGSTSRESGWLSASRDVTLTLTLTPTVKWQGHVADDSLLIAEI